MKNVVLLLLVLAVWACSKEDAEEITFYYGVEMQFTPENNYTSEDNLIVADVDVISDSRCAIGATCVWEGEAEVQVEIKAETNLKTVLSTYDNKVDTIVNFRIELVSVDPYPELGKEIDMKDKSATLIISKIN